MAMDLPPFSPCGGVSVAPVALAGGGGAVGADRARAASPSRGRKEPALCPTPNTKLTDSIATWKVLQDFYYIQCFYTTEY